MTRIEILLLLRKLIQNAHISHTDADDISGCSTRYYVGQEQLLSNIQTELDAYLPEEQDNADIPY